MFLAYAYCLSIAATAVSSVGQDDPSLLERMIRQARPGFSSRRWPSDLAVSGRTSSSIGAGTGLGTPSRRLFPAMAGLGRPVAFANRASQGARVILRGVGLMTGALALFATLVTRAGGAWASSVHTFVVDAEGSSPPDALGGSWRWPLMQGPASR